MKRTWNLFPLQLFPHSCAPFPSPPLLTMVPSGFPNLCPPFLDLWAYTSTFNPGLFLSFPILPGGDPLSVLSPFFFPGRNSFLFWNDVALLVFPLYLFPFSFFGFSPSSSSASKTLDLVFASLPLFLSHQKFGPSPYLPFFPPYFFSRIFPSSLRILNTRPCLSCLPLGLQVHPLFSPGPPRSVFIPETRSHAPPSDGSHRSPRDELPPSSFFPPPKVFRRSVA